MNRGYVLIVLLSCWVVVGQAQVPNAGFESWTAGEPDSWLTNNISSPSGPLIVQTSDRRSGSWAAEGRVVDFMGFGISGFMVSGPDGQGFPVSQRYATLSGWYKFAPVSGDVFIVVVSMLRGQTGIGGGAVALFNPLATYTMVNVPIFYGTGEVPDTCIITMGVYGDTLSGLAHPGSVFKVDDLSLSGTVSGVDDGTAGLPTAFTLYQNFPNPFNPSTVISFDLPVSGMVNLTVVNILGEEVATLVRGDLPAGRHHETFGAGSLASGVYFYRLTVVPHGGGAAYTAARKFILAR